jgi:protein quaking
MALVGNSSFLDQDGLEHGSPLSASTLMNNGSPGDLNGWGGDVMLFVSDPLSLLFQGLFSFLSDPIFEDDAI